MIDVNFTGSRLRISVGDKVRFNTNGVQYSSHCEWEFYDGETCVTISATRAQLEAFARKTLQEIDDARAAGYTEEYFAEQLEKRKHAAASPEVQL